MATRKPLAVIAGKVKQWVTGDKLPYDTLPTGTGANTVAAGDDARLSDAREWSAQTVDQAEAEAGTGTTRCAWTAQRVRQAAAAWWNTASSAFGRTLANVVDAAAGRTALGLGTAATATVTTSATDTTAGRLLKVGDFGLGGTYEVLTGSWNNLSGSTRWVGGVLTTVTDGPLSTNAWMVGQYIRVDAGNGIFTGSVAAMADGMRTFTRTRVAGVWQSWVELPRTGGDASFANLTTTGNTTLGNSSSDTVAISGPTAIGASPVSSQALRIVNSSLTGDSQFGVVASITGSPAATTLVSSFASLPAVAAGSQTCAEVTGLRIYNTTKGSGATITTVNGVRILDQTAGNFNYGITSEVLAGTNKRNLNITGNAENYLAGNLLCAATISSSFRVEAVTSGSTSAFIRAAATGTGEAGFLFDGSNGDFTGSDYGWLKQKDNLAVELASLGGPLVLTAGSGAQERVRIDNTTGTVRPGADNTQSLGEASFRWSAVHTSGIAFPATQNASADANTLDDYREASYTATATGMTTAPTGSVSFVKTGNSVTMTIPAISGTSNATTFTLTGGPTTMRPSASRIVPARVQDNGGAVAWGMATIGTDGVITLNLDANGAAFTATGTKATAACTFSYTI